MGGVKNRDEKKKKAHVYSSGAGGGGSKGAAVVDKRNQELNCPFCDKIFKQAGRYQEHIKSKHSDEQGKSDTDIAASSSSSTSAPLKNNMIDVGSKGGYYTEKSPKIFLLEWCQKEKRPKPRYTVQNKGDDKFGCKVVMPDERNNDKDIVVFLPEQFFSNSQNEAQMIVAVVALARVAGDRQYERILPKQYLWVWEAAKKMNVEREEMRQRRDKQKADTVERKKQQAHSLKLRAPKVVTMSSDKQRMVEGLVRDSQSTSSSMTNLRGLVIDEVEISKFSEMGFDQEDILQGYSACGGTQADFNDVLDWMCVNLEESSLPKKFRSDGKSRAVSIVRTSKSVSKIEDPFVKQLMNYGYESSQCENALQVCAGDLQSSLLHLFNQFIDGDSNSQVYECNEEEEQEEWNEECEALLAIYEDKVSVVDNNCVEVTIDIDSPDDFLPDWVLFSEDSQHQLDFKLIVRKLGDYPDQLPFIGVFSVALPQQLLRQVTRMLISYVTEEELFGSPMICELVAKINDGLQDVQPEARTELQLEPEDDVPSEHDIMQFKINNIAKSSAINKSDEKLKHKNNRYEMQRQSDKLYQSWLEYEKNDRLCDIKNQRKKLPAAYYRTQVLQSVDKFRVVVISGATGCGKTTQVPQFVLEHFMEQKKGGECSIVCTQPRKISAIGVATRVADERGQSVGETIGYHVRLDNKFSKNTRLLFCTTGIMLRRMIGDPQCQNFTHIVVDEVHERSVDSDLLLLLLKRILRQNQNLKVILMSATADADLFASYFGDVCEVDIVSIPGFTHPVRDFFLEDVVEMTEFQVGKRSKWAKQQLSKEEKKESKDEIAVVLDGKHSENTAHTLRWIDESLVNYELIEKLLIRIVMKEKEEGSLAFLSDWDELNQSSTKSKQNRDNGAILVFLPGMEEINKTMRQLQQSANLMSLLGNNGLLLLPLHGSLPPWQQSKVFQPPPAGCKKIVLATNIAETSITIPDVTCVVDCGRVREMAYDFYKGLKVMKTVWVAKAQSKQRRGRAGRVRPGVCFKLFSHGTWDSLCEYATPEILHTALEPLILQVKTMDAFSDNDIYDIFMEALTPPGKPAVDQATNRLLVMQALQENQQLTPLGLHLARLPLDPPVGKMLIFGVLLGCIEPVVTIAAAISYGKPLFLNAFEKRDEIDQIRKQLLRNCVEMRSDHLAYITIYNMWIGLDVSERRDFCDNYYVSNQVLEGMRSLRKDYMGMLQDMGFLSSERDYDNRNSDNARFVKSAVCAGFYPNVLRVQHPEAKYKKVAAGSVQVENNPKDIKFFERVKGRTFIHPQSLNFSVGQYESGWMVYTDMVETSKVYVREASMVPIYSLLLFGGQISVQHDRGLLLLDDWATFKAPPKIAVLVKQLREQVHQLLKTKIQSVEFQFQGNKVITAMMELLRTDGF